jgi:hypothetical protein
METIRGDKEAVRDQIDAAKAAQDRTLVTGHSATEPVQNVLTISDATWLWIGQ